MKKILIIALGLFLAGVFAGCTAEEPADPSPGSFPASEETVVGEGIAIGDITQFYYTLSSSTNPPVYQRYRFSAKDGVYVFDHEAREGDHWPLTEQDTTEAGSKELSEEEWETFFGFLKGGTVKAREEDTSSGGSGPWLYLYWDGDRDLYQEYSFPTAEAEAGFEDFCLSLKEASGT